MNYLSTASIALLTLACTSINASADLPTNEVDAIHSGETLGQTYDGSGVTVAFIDQGFDPNHITFTCPGDPTRNRVKAFYLWNGSKFELKSLSDVTTDYSNDFHGTHVAGIAAGGYNGTGNYNDGTGVKRYSSLPLIGVAPNADIVMAGGPSLNSSMLSAGLSKVINEYGKNSGKPMVINLSLGDINGSHSGSGAGATGSALLNYVKNGAIVCIAAGNEGQMRCAVNVKGEGSKCVGLPFSNSQTNSYLYTTPRLKAGVDPDGTLTTSSFEAIDVEFIVYDSENGTICYSRSLADIYKDPQKSVGGSSTAMLGCAVDTNFDTWFSADSYIRIISSGMVDTYGPQVKERSEWNFMVATLLKGSESSRYKPGLYIHCREDEYAFGYTTGGIFSSYGIQESGSYPAWSEGSANGSMTAIATLDDVIAVGACSASYGIGYLNGQMYGSRYKPGEIWPMSSYGTNTFTGERLPHVIAPGYNVVSAINRYYNDRYNVFCAETEYNGVTYNWKEASGTSMATPFVTGTIALWLQADPTLTVKDIKKVFKETNTYPDDILALPENDQQRLQWGGGMIQPLEGLKYVLNNKAGVSAPTADDMLIENYGTEIRVFLPGRNIITATIYTVYGSAVASATAHGNETAIATDNLPRGLYILEVHTGSGRFTRKIKL